jgi:hypothetical protein
MNSKYYTYRIRITNLDHVQAEIRDANNNLLGEPSGAFGYTGETQTQIQELHQLACKGELTETDVETFGERLFDTLFDEGLRRDFFGYYDRARQEDALLRIELDADERQFPNLAALPWEFLRVPAPAGYGTIWLGTTPDIVFSRRRVLWKTAKPLQLNVREQLRVALAVAVPDDLGPVKYEEILDSLKKLARTERIELLEPVIPAKRASIDEVLSQKPHIFHFIGHGRLVDEAQQEKGQIALIKAANLPDWVDADDFSDLFNRHQPGVIVLQACESGTLSASRAFVGIASQIVQQNIPVVVAMQYQVSNLTATRFALEFYQRLADNDPVDKAVQEGRRRIALGPSGYNRRDFATPILFMRVRDGHLFQRQTGKLGKTEVNRLKAEAEHKAQNNKYDDAIKIWKDIRDFGPEDLSLDREIERLQEQKIAFLKQQARRLEQNEAYDEALTVWQEIGVVGTNYAEAEHEIERLKQKKQDSGSLQGILQQLSRRMKELKGLYFPVARRLKRMQKEGIDDEGDILLGVVQQFLDNSLSADEFSEMWQQASSSVLPKQEEPNYEALTKRLARGEIIPVLGPEIHHLSGLPLPSSTDLVQALAKDARYENFAGPLSMISQYYEMTEYGRGTLLQTVQEKIGLKPEIHYSHPLYQLLAAIQDPILVITACYDRLLERYFIENGKKFVVISHVKIDNTLGMLLLVYSDRAKPEEPCTAESISPLKLLENGYAIIYKFCGCFGISPSETGGTMDSVMISEEDYFSFAKQAEKVIPGYLANQIGRSSLLFLGSILKDWQDRLVLNAILEKNRTYRGRSYAVREQPTDYEIAYWKFHGVDLYRVGLRTFAEKLSENMR